MTSTLFVYAYNADGGLIRFTSGFPEGNYSVGLFTSPPTVHRSGFEESLLQFSSKLADCQIRNIARHDNSAEKRPLYMRFFFDQTGVSLDGKQP